MRAGRLQYGLEVVPHKAVEAKAGTRLSLKGGMVAVHFVVTVYQPFFSG